MKPLKGVVIPIIGHIYEMLDPHFVTWVKDGCDACCHMTIGLCDTHVIIRRILSHDQRVLVTHVTREQMSGWPALPNLGGCLLLLLLAQKLQEFEKFLARQRSSAVTALWQKRWSWMYLRWGGPDVDFITGAPKVDLRRGGPNKRWTYMYLAKMRWT